MAIRIRIWTSALWKILQFAIRKSNISNFCSKIRKKCLSLPTFRGIRIDYTCDANQWVAEMIANLGNEKTALVGLTPRDDVKKTVSELLKRVDNLIRKGDLDQAEHCVTQAREIDPKNIYAYAFEERIHLLKEQAHENSIAEAMCKSAEENRLQEEKQRQPITAQTQKILINPQPTPSPVPEKAPSPQKPVEGKLCPTDSERTDLYKTVLNEPKQNQVVPGIHPQTSGETQMITEKKSDEDRNLKIQRLIKIAVDAARKEVEQKQQEIREREREKLLRIEQIRITEAARRAEEKRQAEIRRKAEEQLLRRIQEEQMLNQAEEWAAPSTERIMGHSSDFSKFSESAKIQSPNQAPTNPSRQETLSRYKLVLLSVWADGAVCADEEATLSELRRSFSISAEEHARLEEEVKHETYIEAFKKAWNSGTISPENASVLAELRERFHISSDEHFKIESTLLWEIQPVKNRPTLLVVDDDERLLNIVSKTLNHAGFITRSVTTSDEAYSYLREASPDLILCDVNLETSTMGGFAFYEKVRGLEQLRETPFIFLSGLSDEALVRAGKEMGVDDYLSKPVSEETLVATIKGKLRRYHELKRRRN